MQTYDDMCWYYEIATGVRREPQGQADGVGRESPAKVN
jgi:hypothetical protein